MSETFTVAAEPREEFGKNSSRRMRYAGRVPGVVYGGGGPVIPVTVDPAGIERILHSDSGHNTVFMLEVRGKAPARAMLREWQAEPVHGGLLHVDLLRIASDVKLKLKVPIHVTGEPKGVKLEGGIFEFVLRELEVECLPDDIPESVTVDVSGLALNQNLRVAELPINSKVTVLTDPNRVVAHVVVLKIEEEKPAETAEAAPAEPEVIRKGKAEEEGAEEAAGDEKKEKEPAKGREKGKEKE